LAIESTGLSSIRSIGVPATGKELARSAQTSPEKENAKPSSALVIARQGSEPVFKQADAFRQTVGIQSASGQKERIAIDAYESIAKEQQRQNIQQLLGVDTFV
tara:strand:- start:5547 stop:5855 length:309 start_codon:yes stop_codon:yes gene_type:complete